MTTTATGRIGYGGSGFGPEYITSRKRSVEKHEDDRGSASSQSGYRRTPQEELEVFLFTVKDPIRSALGQLMSLIKVTLIENPESHDSRPEIISGPLGYTSVRAVRPMAYVPTKTIFKPVTR
ncbi:MAG: hypothetical protein CVV27_03005 [Candidatus Melainabacteria bacterium HGW-Melainabacteria-1]|nr:MAG: hypothetical protein CVV27_03005 [Candidatus Melainabacteria bacterium HGW-Melainabacteria-1]